MPAVNDGRRPSRSHLVLVVTPIVALIAAAYVGDALTTTWADKHPLLLTLLNPRSRVLVLTTNQLDTVSYYLAAGLRLLASDPLFYLLGRWYGDAMVVWVEKRSKTFGEQVRLYETAFSKAASNEPNNDVAAITAVAIAIPFVIALVELPIASRPPRISAGRPSNSPDISAIPCALSEMGPNVSIETITPTVVSIPIPVREKK